MTAAGGGVPVALRLRGVRKAYGRTVALDGLDLDVPEGCVMGLVGPNGAGKTTAFGVVAGVVRPDAGLVDVLGGGPFDPMTRGGQLALLPQDCALNPHSSARQLLRFYAALGGADARAAAREADRVLDVVRLGDKADARVGQLSHGMKRRLAVAQALLGDPRLVLLDEPTGGLDPHLVVDMRDVLRAERGRRTLVVSSHILSDLEAICDEVAFLEAGRCMQAGPVRDVLRASTHVTVTLAAPVALDAVAAVLDGRGPEVDGATIRYRLHPGEDPAAAHAALVPALVAAGAAVLEVRLGETLEQVYLARRRAWAEGAGAGAVDR